MRSVNDGRVLPDLTTLLASHVGMAERVEQTRDFHGSQTVSDLIRAGGRVYDLLRDNCHHAAERIMKLP
ncbi:hypothetical protein INR49_007997 [Caranx melampygus]|nr:hypothetical protein INR49_007997 [Caranx melampygus]